MSTHGLRAHILPDPPPYTPPAPNLFTTEEDEEDEEDDGEDSQPTTNLIIHAPTIVHGSGNIIAVPPPDVPRLTAALVATVSQKVHLPRNFSIQINCDVNITGDRNIVGSPAIRPFVTSPQQQAVAAAAARQVAQRHGVTERSPLNGNAGVAMPMHGERKRRTSEVCISLTEDREIC
jgi:hypothetical protein